LANGKELKKLVVRGKGQHRGGEAEANREGEREGERKQTKREVE